jgi:RNA chaperone Hfq
LYDQDLIRKDPSVNYLFKQFKAKAEVVFVCYRKEVRGIIKKIRTYDFKVEGRKKFLEKLYILYFFKPDSIEAIKQHITIDDDVVEEHLGLLHHKEDRLEIPDDILQKCFNEKTAITITMRNGHVLKGKIHSFGIFSIRLQIDQRNRVMIFRHAIYDLAYRKTT